MKLLIVESPTKTKTVSKYINDPDLVVKASVGHIRDLPKSNKEAVDIAHGFRPNYITVKGKEALVHELKGLADQAETILLATDPDREGEAIAWHLKELLCGKDKECTKRVQRVVFNEITLSAVEEALKKPRKIDDSLRKSQEARRVLDRLFGYDLSGLIWKKVRYGLSAGRVQSPALRILVAREKEVRAFIPEPFYVITGEFNTASKEVISLTCQEEPSEEHEADRIVKAARQGSWSVVSVKETRAKRSPYAPFTTSTLQQTASTRLNMSPSRTMRVAQGLYEAGHITYMRTDSTTISKEILPVIHKTIQDLFGKELVMPREFRTKVRNAQEAHEAIRPTDPTLDNAGTTPEQKKLYALIRARTLASQMIDAQIMRTKISANIGEADTIPNFATNGARVLERGWFLADPAAQSDDVILPELAEGDSLELSDVTHERKETQPPKRYTEAGLIKELEKRGIGRPSTYASIIKTIVDRGYVTRENRTLLPTDTGEVVSDFLEAHFDTYISDTFTAEMENKLDEIAEGSREYAPTLEEFYTPFHEMVLSKESMDKVTTLGVADPQFVCPKCKSSMIIKLGRSGKFISCGKYPECDGALTIEGKEIEPNRPIGTHPESGEEIFILEGPYGPYVQVGEKTKENKKPKRASIPKDKELSEVTIDDALKYLSLPKTLGQHPETEKNIVANIGRFGPYVMHDGDFRSLKTDDVYTIELARALEIIAEPKKTRTRKSAATKKASSTRSKKKK